MHQVLVEDRLNRPWLAIHGAAEPTCRSAGWAGRSRPASVLDLDPPDGGSAFDAVVATARLCRRALADAGLSAAVEHQRVDRPARRRPGALGSPAEGGRSPSAGLARRRPHRGARPGRGHHRVRGVRRGAAGRSSTPPGWGRGTGRRGGLLPRGSPGAAGVCAGRLGTAGRCLWPGDVTVRTAAARSRAPYTAGSTRCRDPQELPADLGRRGPRHPGGPGAGHARGKAPGSGPGRGLGTAADSAPGRCIMTWRDWMAPTLGPGSPDAPRRPSAGQPAGRTRWLAGRSAPAVAPRGPAPAALLPSGDG